MADSISKLSVVITGDASPLQAAMARASAHVDSWSRGMATMAVQNDKWLAGLEKMNAASSAQANPFEAMRFGASGAAGSVDRLNAASVKLSTTISALKGNWGAAFAVGGPALLGIAASALALRRMANAGDELLQTIGADKLETWSGQWARLNEQLGVTGMKFTLIAREATSDLADSLSAINQAMFPDAVAYVNSIKAREAAEKKMAEDKEKAANAAEKQAKANKEAAEQQQRERDAMLDMANAQRDRADQIRDSVMTPAEEMERTFRELRSMFGAGLIDEETAMRAGLKARKAFDEGSGARANDAQARPGVAAADKFTMAGFSAVQSGLREMDRLERVQKDQLKEEQNQTVVMKEVRDAIKGQTVVELVGESP